MLVCLLEAFLEQFFRNACVGQVGPFGAICGAFQGFLEPIFVACLKPIRQL